jgi:hypothetical protein
MDSFSRCCNCKPVLLAVKKEGIGAKNFDVQV